MSLLFGGLLMQDLSMTIKSEAEGVRVFYIFAEFGCRQTA